uniref:Uncharacterized protein n=1 Tax=Bangiopsis subsimplex TaxID=139980 RepID=A0A1C9CCN1_9RHOD|nr:hypothetical protein Bangp_068 [Bangiopsis subsimplex]AOM66150.1 hypothetical protein Bangp_068 [Bangiopsis subsimplex]ARO90490.1 hypothetical protein [Bangiopsis subsimplex]
MKLERENLQESAAENKNSIEEIYNVIKQTKQTIHIDKITNFYLYNKLNSVFNFEKIAYAKSSKFKRQLNNLINDIRFSGYFSTVNLSFSTSNREIIFNIELEINSILNTVEILNITNLIIPSKEVVQLSNELIGYPKSLAQLNLLSSKIRSWYINRGYQWLDIKVYDILSSNHKVFIEIVEGLITDVKYKLCPLINHEISPETPLLKFVPFNFINQITETFLKIGNKPNILMIEKAMHLLKETRFFYNFYYDIKSFSNNSKIEVIIYFVPYRDNKIYLNLEKILQKVEFIIHEEKTLQNLIIYILQNSKQHYLNKKINSSTKRNLSALSKRYIYNLIEHSFFNNKFLSADNNNPLLELQLATNEDFELYQYHSRINLFQEARYIGSRYDFINFNFKQEDRTIQYDISYNFPLEINRSTFRPIAIRIFDNLTFIKDYTQNFRLNYLLNKKLIIPTIYKLKRKGLEIFFKRKFQFNGINLSSIIATRKIYYNNINFKRNHFLMFNLSKQKIFNLPDLLSYAYITSKQLGQLVTQKFNIINLRAQLPMIDDLYHPTTGNFLQLDFVQFKSFYDLTESFNTNLYKINQLYFLKYINYSKIMPTHKPSLYHLFISKIFLGYIVGNKNLYSLADKLRYQKYTSEKVGFTEFSHWPNSCNEYLLEYHYRFFKYTNPVLFIKILKDSPLYEEYPFPHVQGELFYSKRLNLSNLSTGKYFGIGWEFRTIISQIPPIRIEFLPQLPGTEKFCIRVIPYLY